MGRAGAPPPSPRPCSFAGCTVVVANRLGFCVEHYLVAWPCSFAESCSRRCAAHSRTHLCQEHAWYAEKVRRTSLAARLEAEGEE